MLRTFSVVSWNLTKDEIDLVASRFCHGGKRGLVGERDCERSIAETKILLRRFLSRLVLSNLSSLVQRLEQWWNRRYSWNHPKASVSSRDWNHCDVAQSHSEVTASWLRLWHRRFHASRRDFRNERWPGGAFPRGKEAWHQSYYGLCKLISGQILSKSLIDWR